MDKYRRCWIMNDPISILVFSSMSEAFEVGLINLLDFFLKFIVKTIIFFYLYKINERLIRIKKKWRLNFFASYIFQHIFKTV